MDVDMRLMEALGGHHGHHLQNPAPTETESNRYSELELAPYVSELTNLLRSIDWDLQGSENSLYPNGHLSQNHSNGPLTPQLATTSQLCLNDHALLQSLGLGEQNLQRIIGYSLSVAVSTHDGLQNQDGTHNNSHLQRSEIDTNSHDEEMAEIQRGMVELPQPATGANSRPPSIHDPGSFSGCSGTSPVGLAREDSQSMSPAPHRSSSQVLEMSPAIDVQTPQLLARNSMGRVRNSVSSSSKALQDDPYEDPAKVAERERVRGENRVRKKRWRESNQDRNKDNDLRCRVTKRGNKIWGSKDSEEKREWIRTEFSQRRKKREAKERARAADDTGLNMGAGSSSVFPAYNDSSPSPTSAINTGPIPSNPQTPFSDTQAGALQDLVSLLAAGGGLRPDESLSSPMEPEAPTISEPSRSSIAQSEDRSVRDPAGDDSEASMSLEQIETLLEVLTESMVLDEPANTSSPHSINLPSHHQAPYPTQDHIATLTSSWRDRQIPSIPSVGTPPHGPKRGSPDDPSPLSKPTYKPPSKNPIALSQHLQAILQSSDRGQFVSFHQVNSSYAASFGNSENMNRGLIKPPQYRPASKPSPISITTGPGSAVASHAKSNEHEKKIKSMGFPPLMAGMKPK